MSRARLFPRRGVMLALTLGLAVAAWFVPAPIDAPAAMAVQPAAFTVDAWYLTPLALSLRLQGGGLWLAIGVTLLAAAGVPWLLGRRRPPADYQAVVEASRCHACTQCTQDCPFDAVTMVPRTDGKGSAAHAFVDPGKCVGCGVCVGSCDSEAMALTWFDTRREEARLEADIAAQRRGGGPECVAFVAGDLDGALALFQLERWRARLPGYQVHYVPTASWVRPRLVERLLHAGTQGVLIVRDARIEAAARDGNRWVSDRLAGVRAPVFRPERARGSRSWQVVDFDPARPAALTVSANAFRRAARPGAARESVTPAPAVARPLAAGSWLAGLVLAGCLGAGTLVPSRLPVVNPAPPTPEFVFSFKAFGDRNAAPSISDTDAFRPVHMRGRAVDKPQRADVVVRLSVDGRTEERRFRAKGISRDGPALDQWRIELTPGPHAIVVEVITGPATPPQRWTGRVDAEARRLCVVSFEPGSGFRRE